MIDLEFFLITVFNDPKNNMLGNISAVFLLEEPLSEDLFQRIANDLNQPASTFIWEADEVKLEGNYQILAKGYYNLKT